MSQALVASDHGRIWLWRLQGLVEAAGVLGCWGAGVLEDLGGLEFRVFRASGSRVSGSGRCLELAS